MKVDLLRMPEVPLSAHSRGRDWATDLRLSLLLEAMSGGNAIIYDACEHVLTRPLTDEASLRVRRAVVREALANEAAFSKLFNIAAEAVQGIRAYAEFLKPKYDRIIPNEKKIVTEAEIARLSIKHLKALHATLRRCAFKAEPLRVLSRALDTACSEEAIRRLETRVDALYALKSADGLCVSGHIGVGLKPSDILLATLCEPGKGNRGKAAEVSIPLSSLALVQNAEALVQSALTPVFRIVSEFNRTLQRFFESLRFHLGFLVGCASLRRRFQALNVPLCEPQIVPETHAAQKLVDASLALKERHAPVGNDLRWTGKRLILITGPNQGGKTTFLRSVGLAQVMAQCGLFVTAKAYVCPLFSGIFTHFPSGEDRRMERGLLEVELQKLSDIIDQIQPNGLLLMNESFQTTLPLDAKRLAEEIVSGLTDAGVKVAFVTHLVAYAAERWHTHRDDTLSLTAQRESDGKNTFRVQEGKPFESAFGMALFNEVLETL